MSEELLNIDKLATLEEFRYLLMEVLDRSEPITKYDLSSLCKNYSLSFALSFDNTIRFLETLSLIKIYEDSTISRSESIVNNELRSDYDLSIFITQRTFEYLEIKGLLSIAFNKKSITFDIHNDTFVININKIPLGFSVVKVVLLNMGVVSPNRSVQSKLLVSKLYKHYIKETILIKVFELEEMMDISVTEINSESNMVETKKTYSFFVSYTHKDETFKDELKKHLSGLIRNKSIKTWDDRAIVPGEDWDKEIKKRLEEADVILFLVSSDFMASDYINDVEIQKAIDRHNSSVVRIIPVIIRPCDLASLPLKNYQAIPKDAKPISSWHNADEAYLDVVNQIKKILY